MNDANSKNRKSNDNTPNDNRRKSVVEINDNMGKLI